MPSAAVSPRGARPPVGGSPRAIGALPAARSLGAMTEARGHHALWTKSVVRSIRKADLTNRKVNHAWHPTRRPAAGSRSSGAAARGRNPDECNLRCSPIRMEWCSGAWTLNENHSGIDSRRVRFAPSSEPYLHPANRGVAGEAGRCPRSDITSICLNIPVSCGVNDSMVRARSTSRKSRSASYVALLASRSRSRSWPRRKGAFTTVCRIDNGCRALSRRSARQPLIAGSSYTAQSLRAAPYSRLWCDSMASRC